MSPGLRAAVLAPVMIWFFTSCAAQDPPTARLAGRGLIAAPGSRIDSETGLPDRLVHEASGIVLVLIPSGEFWMGSPDGEPGRSTSERRHRRIIRRPFYLGETEVTTAQFRRFADETGYSSDADRGTPVGGHAVGSFAAVEAGDREWHSEASWRNPWPNLNGGAALNTDDRPALHLSWNDACAFAAHYGLRLPTEAEWEHACRAGGETAYFWGDDPATGAGYANVRDESAKRRFASTNLWFRFDDGAATTTPVRSYRPNAWGLYDMVGNVAEWVEDAYGPYPADGADERPPTAAAAVSGFAIRGGSWVDHPDHARSASRPTMSAASRRDFIGFRVALSVE